MNSDELRIQMHNLCIRYHMMIEAENAIRRYDDNCVKLPKSFNKEVRDVLIKGFKINEKLYDEQYRLVEKLIDNKK